MLNRQRGNKVAKGHQLRFSFGPDVRLLEAYLDPSREPELQVKETDESRSKTNQRIYQIGHLEKQQEVTFRFALDGQPPRDRQPHPFNAEGDVAFVRRDMSRIREDQEHLQPFLTYLLLLIIIPPLFRGLLSNVGPLAAAGLGLVFLLLLAPHIGPTGRVIAQILALLSSTRPRGHQATISVNGGRGVPNLLVAQDATIYGGVDLRAIDESDRDGEEAERTHEDAAAE